MVDRLATIDMGRKVRRGCCGDAGSPLGHHLTRRQCGLGRGLPLYQVASWSIQPFGHNRHGPKSAERLLWGRWVPMGHHLTRRQCGLGRGLPLYQVASWSIQPFGHKCRNATLLRLGIPLRTIFIRSSVVTRQNIYSTRALSYCSIPNKIKYIMFYKLQQWNILHCGKFTH